MPPEESELLEPLQNGLVESVHALDQFHLRYALIGGVATSFRGRPRFTRDLDFLLEVPQLVLPAFLQDLHARGFTFDTQTTIQEWTRQHLTVLSFHGIRIDWLKPVIPVYLHVLDRARPEPWLGCSIRIALPEGLILTKLLAFRTRDQFDIESLLATNRGQLDLDWISQEWQTLASLDDPRMQWFQEMVQRRYLPPPTQEAP